MPACFYNTYIAYERNAIVPEKPQSPPFTLREVEGGYTAVPNGPQPLMVVAIGGLVKEGALKRVFGKTVFALNGDADDEAAEITRLILEKMEALSAILSDDGS